MKAPLGRTARIWVLTLLLGGVSLLVAIAWIAVGHSRPKPGNSQPPEVSDGLAEATTPPVIPAEPPVQPTRGKLGLLDQRSPSLQAPAKPAQVEPHPADPPGTDFTAESTFQQKTGVLKGLSKLVGLVASPKDARQAGAK